MIDLIVFTVEHNKYAVKIDNIQRIIQASELTDIPGSHPFIDGMMSYEGNVLKVLSFRKLIGLESYDEGLQSLFARLKVAHADWVGALEKSLTTGCEFTKTTNPHMCELGKWIDSFTSYDDSITTVFNNLVEQHKQLHTRGGESLELYKDDTKQALNMFHVEIQNIYQQTMGALDTFIAQFDTVANSLQKLLIYENDTDRFAIKVDSIEDIAHIDESEIKSGVDEQADEHGLLELEGVLDLDGVLINVIKTLNLPK